MIRGHESLIEKCIKDSLASVKVCCQQIPMQEGNGNWILKISSDKRRMINTFIEKNWRREEEKSED